MTDAEKKPCCAAEPAERDTAPSCCRHKDRTPEEYRALANRLSRIEGQVRGIRAMLDKDEAREFRDVLRDTNLDNATTTKEAARSTSAKGGTGGINSQ